MTTAAKVQTDLDKELVRLAGLVQDCTQGSNRWNIIWKRIDVLLDKRGKLSPEKEMK